MEGPGSGTAASESDAAQAGNPPAHPSKDIPKSVSGAIFSSSPVLDLSQSGLQHLGDILKIPTLKQLHLQKNALCTIPRDFFQLLPNLTWLDLRYNRIQALPPGIGSHRYLKTLLLERNPIKVLPVELGNVTTLRALNLRHCPLEFPPPVIVQKGPAAILCFLQACAAELSSHQDPAAQDSQEEWAPNGETTGSRGPRWTRLKEVEDLLPPVETLDLSELRKSSGSWEDWPSKEEIRRFWKLRQEIVEKEQAEVLENQLLATELPPNLRAVLHSREDVRPSSRQSRRGKIPSKGIMPGLVQAHPARTETERLEERRAAALRELQEKQALLEQRRRDRRALQEWRERAQAMRKRSVELRKLLAPPRRALGALKIPFATEPLNSEKLPTNPPGKRGPSKEKSTQTSTDLSISQEWELEGRLRQHIQHLRERRKAFQGMAPLKEMRKATDDLETARKLLDGVMKLSKSHGCPALPGDRPLCLPALQHQNMFSNTKY